MRAAVLATITIAFASGCGPTPTPDPVPPSASATAAPQAADVLHGPIASYDLASNNLLLKRLRTSPYVYFRFVNLTFAERVCTRFADAKASMPLVNLHGDAHLEQYAVTSLGRGLADYDDASTGPAVLDLVRFGSSLQLAAKERGWSAAPSVGAFLDGYRAALEKPEAERPLPKYVERVKAKFSGDRLEFLDDVEKLMHPLDDAEEPPFNAGYARYVKLMRGLHPELAGHFFTMKKHGRLRSGVGSALSNKFLIRVEGETLDDSDDVVLEAKELRDLGGISCITASVGGGAFRILLGQTRIGGQPMRFLAQIPRGPDDPLDEQPFWVQAWLDNYHELSISDEGLTQEELLEVSRDVGEQLGRGHVMKIADPIGPQLRAAQLQMLRELGPRVLSTIDDMTALTMSSWRQFVVDAAQVD